MIIRPSTSLLPFRHFITLASEPQGSAGGRAAKLTDRRGRVSAAAAFDIMLSSAGGRAAKQTGVGW